MTRSEIIRFLILRTIGNFLLLFAIFGVFATFGPSIYYEVQYQIIRIRGVRFTIASDALSFERSASAVEKSKTGEFSTSSNNKSPLGELMAKESKATFEVNNSGFAAIISRSKEQVLIPKDTDFSIVIPKIGANARVFPNIDASKESEFLPILQQGVAHAKGSVFPGMKGNTYLFAHSTDNFWDVGRYNAVFYLLKNLEVGDDIAIFFENRRHNYKVSQSKIVDANDVSSLVGAQEVKKEQLILQTCWPPGTTWKRLIVVAVPK